MKLLGQAQTGFEPYPKQSRSKHKKTHDLSFRRNSSVIQFWLEMRELVETQNEIQMKIRFPSFEMHSLLT